MPSAQRRQDHVLQRVDEHVGPPVDQRVEQQEAGDASGRAKLGASRPVKGRIGKATPKSQDEDSPQRKSGSDSSTSSRDRPPRRASCRAVEQEQPAREAERDRDSHGERGQFDRSPAGSRRSIRATPRRKWIELPRSPWSAWREPDQRIARAAAGRAPSPGAWPRSRRGRVRRQRHRGGIDRQQPQHAEHEAETTKRIGSRPGAASKGRGRADHGEVAASRQASSRPRRRHRSGPFSRANASGCE